MIARNLAWVQRLMRPYGGAMRGNVVAGLAENIGVDALLDLTGADREAKAYAFLYAAFRRTEVGNNPVRDAIDCLIPFMAPYLADIPGQIIKVDAVCKYMKSKFGFDFPMYAMQQLISDLPKHGLADYNRTAKAHVARSGVKDDFKGRKIRNRK